MDTQLVMSKEEIDEMRKKAQEVKETGIPSKELPQTKYEIRVQEHQNETENVDMTNYIQSSDIKHLNNNVVLAELLQYNQNEFELQWSLDESLFED